MAENSNRTPLKDTAGEPVDSVLELQELETDNPEVEAHGCFSGFSVVIE